VGQTLHFRVQEFQFDKKTGKSDVFVGSEDGSLAVIEPFTMIQVILSSAAQPGAVEGYGLKLDKVTVLPYTLYSYLTPANISLLATTVDAAQRRAAESVAQGTGTAYTFRQNLEQRHLGFLAKVENKNVFVADSELQGMLKLQSEEGDVIPGL